MDDPIVYDDLLASFRQFLIVFTHVVLHARGLYPSCSFENFRMYDLPVPRCRHPLVIEWVENMAISCMFYISRVRKSCFNLLR